MQFLCKVTIHPESVVRTFDICVISPAIVVGLLTSALELRAGIWSLTSALFQVVDTRAGARRPCPQVAPPPLNPPNDNALHSPSQPLN